MISAYEEIPSIWRVWDYDPGLPGLTFTAEEANSTVAMKKFARPPEVSLEYTTDGSTWSDFIVSSAEVEGTTVTLANVGDKMAVRAKTTNSGFGTGNNHNYNYFVMTGKIAASGSIMYLLKNDGDLDTISSYSCFNRMFRNCASLTQAPDLPATTLEQSSYDYMFENCSSLTQAPELPATSLTQFCYRRMFSGCTSLNEIKIGYTGNFSGDGVPSHAFANWVNGVSASGTFYYNGSDTARGAFGIPENWTIQTF